MRPCAHDVLNSTETVASPALPLADRDHTGDASLLLHRVDRASACATKRHDHSDLGSHFACDTNHPRPFGVSHVHGCTYRDCQHDSHCLCSSFAHADLHARPFGDADLNLHAGAHRHSESATDRHCHPYRAFAHIRVRFQEEMPCPMKSSLS